jgi:hypothetical protein
MKRTQPVRRLDLPEPRSYNRLSAIHPKTGSRLIADADRDPLNETIDQAAEALTFSSDPGNIAKRTAKAYLKTVLAGAAKGTVAAAMAMGGATAGVGKTAIGQDQGVRKPEEQQGSQTQDANTAAHTAEYYVSSTGDINNFAVVKDGSKLYFTIKEKD